MKPEIAFRDDPDGVLVAIWAVPGAARDHIVGVHGDALKVRVSAPPEGGKANRSVESLLSVTFECRAEVVSGLRSRKKRVLLVGASLADAESGLSDLLRASGDC